MRRTLPIMVSASSICSHGTGSALHEGFHECERMESCVQGIPLGAHDRPAGDIAEKTWKAGERQCRGILIKDRETKSRLDSQKQRN